MDSLSVGSVGTTKAQTWMLQQKWSLEAPNVEKIATVWLFPGLLLSMVIGNQLWTIGPFLCGQVISWFNIVSALIIVHKFWASTAYTAILIAGLIISKLTSIVYPLSYTIFAYHFFHESLFCLAGGFVAWSNSTLVYKQLMFVCAVNVPIMFLQAAGIGEWAQFLATENTTPNFKLIPTLFVNNLDSEFWSVIQFRPSGVLYSNNRLSHFVLFALAFQFCAIRGRYWWGTIVLCAMAALAMAKIVFVCYLLMVLLVLWAANIRSKIWALNSVLTMFLFVALYAFIFPGMFEYHLDLILSGHYFFIRVNDFLNALGDDFFLAPALREIFMGTATADWVREPGSYLSGYAQLIPFFPIVAAVGILLVPVYSNGLRLLKSRSSYLPLLSALTLVTVVMYPAAVPVWKAPEYWFIAGFAFLPIYVGLQPGIFMRRKSSATQ